MSRMSTDRPAAPRGRPLPGTRPLPERGEHVRVAAETMAVGALFVLFSLPVVTAGASWCAAAEVVAGWHRGRELPLLRTFMRVVRRDLRAGLALEFIVLAVLAATWFEVHVVLTSRMPGYPVEAAALTLLGSGAVSLVLLTVARRAATGTSWRTAIRAAADRARAVPSTVPLVLAGLACVIALVAVIPAFGGFMAGPLAYAVSAVVAREAAE